MIYPLGVVTLSASAGYVFVGIDEIPGFESIALGQHAAELDFTTTPTPGPQTLSPKPCALNPKPLKPRRGVRF